MAKNWKKAHDKLKTEHESINIVVASLQSSLQISEGRVQHANQERLAESGRLSRAINALHGAAENMRGASLLSSARELDNIAFDLSKDRPASGDTERRR